MGAYENEVFEHYIESREIGLVYSPDDGGWYWQETFGDWLVSRLFDTKEQAMNADDDEMEWS